jgi:class 3 adenylate cyclase
MTDRDIRYCATEDGVNVAYCVEGDGPITILALPAFFESFSLDHLMPVYQQFYRDLGKGRRVVRFDWRGTGLSANVPSGVSLLDRSADIKSVALASGGECVLWAPAIAGPRAVFFAVAHPELVTHLILYGTYAAPRDAFSEELLDGFNNLVSANWQVAAHAMADTNGRREYPEEAGQLGQWYYESVSKEFYTALNAAEGRTLDATAVLPRVRAQTLVLHKIADPIIPFPAGQKLAAAIPGARFVPLEGKGNMFCLGDYGTILASVDALLGDRGNEVQAAVAKVPASFRTVLFTDLVGHTEMMSRLGDEAGRAVLREHETITRNVLKQHGGTEIKTMGDGFMASFGSVTRAVECAIALQRAFAEYNSQLSTPNSQLNVRVGLNAGEPIEEDGDLFGATVILASRIAAKAEGGEILVADTVRGLCSGKGFLFADRGDFVAKGFEDPVRVYEVSWRA